MNMESAPANGRNAGTTDTDIGGLVTPALELMASVLSQRATICAAPAESGAALELFALAVDEIASVAAECGWSGLEAVCRRTAEQLQDLQRQGQALQADDLAFLQQWRALCVAFVAAPTNPATLRALVGHLQDRRWPNPLTAQDAGAMLELVRLWRQGHVTDEDGQPVLVETDPSVQPTLPSEEVVGDAAAPDIAPENGAADTAPLLPDAADTPPPGAEQDPARESAAVDEELSDSSDAAGWSQLVGELGAIAAMAEQMDLWGLQEICERIRSNAELCREDDGASVGDRQYLAAFPPLAYDYLAAPENVEAAAALLDYLRAGSWREPITDEELEGLHFALQHTVSSGLLSDDEWEMPPHLPDETASAPATVTTADAESTLITDTVATADTIIEADTIVEATGPVIETDTDGMAGADRVPGDFPASTFQAEAQTVDAEFIDMLVQELAGMQDELGELLGEAWDPDQPQAARQTALQHYAELIERAALASRTVGLIALEAFLLALSQRLHNVTPGQEAGSRERLMLLPGAILAYLQSPDDPSTGEGLIDLLRGEVWGAPPDAAYLNALARGLAMVQVVQGAATSAARQLEATPEDVVLTLPPDLSQELLDGLLHELPVHTGEFSAAIQRLADGIGSQADIDVAKRAAHTLKGAANTVGVKGIATLTHHVEDILVALSKQGVLPNRALAEVLSNAGDCLEAMGEAVMGTGPEPDYALAVLQSVLDWANRIDREGVPEGEAAEPAVTPTDADRPPAPDQTAAPTATPQQDTMIRVPANLIDELLRLMGETIISTGQVRERLRRLVQQNRLMREQNQVFLQLANELEELVDLRAADSDAVVAATDDEFDPLEFEHYSELHTVSRRLIEAATDAGEMSRDTARDLDDLNELVEVQDRLHAQSQDTVLRTRMLPVGAVASRLQRSVRQAARLLDKRVQLDILGTDTMVDSNILNELVDPLMHMLRNSVDHGIEAAEQRRVAGKSDEGHIELLFLREGNQVVVRCRDDGAGLDLALIRRTAEQRGLLTAGQTVSDDELARLILAPGFSTRTESTQVSGRGIGMDVVHSRVLQLKGTLSLKGTPGQGLEIEIRLPATLISTYAMLVRAQQNVFAISSYGVQDIHYVTAEELQHSGATTYFRLGDELYPLADLCGLLNLPQSRRTMERHEGFPVLLVRQDTGAVHAVRVQEIIDSADLVVKPLGRYVPKVQGVVGATILGDGSVAAVVDLPEVMRKPMLAANERRPGQGRSGRDEAAHQRMALRTALVVDDSLSARRATAQFMKDAGFEVRTAIDGLEAVSILDKWKPDILLVDMEMPRMNGLELTAHVRAREGMAHLPVIMITSRSTEKHRRQAEAAGVNAYLTKPFGDGQLLQHVMELTAA